MKIINTLLFIWQLPQNILGVALTLFYPAKKKYKGTIYNIINVIMIESTKMPSGISLGKYSIVNPRISTLGKLHEIGHCKQSVILGPLYLLIVGLPSIIHNILHSLFYRESNYYKFYTERWADSLSGINRNSYK